MSVRFAADIGGTFTDVVLDKNGLIFSTKLLTTYDDPADAVMQGVDELLLEASVEPEQISLFLHGTTLATNALIERTGAKTALLTTEGHRDVLEMAFENRFEQYDINIDRRPPLVERPLRIGVSQRNSFDGEEIIPLDSDEVARTIRGLCEQGVESFAIGYLHSYANPNHERKTAEIVESIAPNASVSLSSSVCPEIREYERLSTTAANAYIKPLMELYLESLQKQLQIKGLHCPLLLMTSGGGLTTLKNAKEFPIRLVESGPAGGAILAETLSKVQGEPSVLSFDMGGTTAKICLVDDGVAIQSRAFEVDRAYRFKKGSGLPLRIPVIEMVEIGAGGGSVSHVDALKRIQVGPESAGSDPGPVCYARGGQRVTVSDADATTGKLYPTFFAGGSLALEIEPAKQAIEEQIARPLGLNVLDAANAVTEIVDENMTAAAKAHSSEWGKSMNGRVLVAFGGAAPLHAANLAKKLKISKILVPKGAGVGSALGFLLAPPKYEVVRSFFTTISRFEARMVSKLLDEMREEAKTVVNQMAQGPLVQQIRAYMRYVGQGYEVSVLLGGAAQIDVHDLLRRFEETYLDAYGRVLPNVDVEILSWTLSIEDTTTPIESFDFPSTSPGKDVELGEIELFSEGELVSAPVLWRDSLESAKEYKGPLLVTENQTTTIVPKNSILTLSEGGVLHISLGEPS